MVQAGAAEDLKLNTKEGVSCLFLRTDMDPVAS